MSISKSESYAAAGVDVTAGYESVQKMKRFVESTYTAGVLGGIGGFGGAFQPNLTNIKTPVLVSGTDGVGTKLKVAFMTNRHDTVGIDCVAMCANDIICSGAMPLFFLDYIATGKNFPDKIAAIVSGVSAGCRESGCALVGGETAEMPGFYPEDEYDLAGFCVGLADKDKMIDGSAVKEGDLLLGLHSSGVHSNGFSLIRRIFDVTPAHLDTFYEELGCTLGEELLKPTRLYVSAMKALLGAVTVKAASHITGGGFYENIPRMLPDGVYAQIDKGSWRIPPIFTLMAKTGNIPEHDMYNTFNMGIGMVIALSPEDRDKACAALDLAGAQYAVIGRVVQGEAGVRFSGDAE